MIDLLELRSGPVIPVGEVLPHDDHVPDSYSESFTLTFLDFPGFICEPAALCLRIISKGWTSGGIRESDRNLR